MEKLQTKKICDISGQTLAIEGFPKIADEHAPILGCAIKFNDSYGAIFDSHLDNRKNTFYLNEEITKDIIEFVKSKYDYDFEEHSINLY